MDEPSGTAAQGPPDAPSTVTCWQCGQAVPSLEYCVRCGHPLDEELAAARRRRPDRFAAAPEEPATAISVFSTLLPQLPRAEMEAFRLAAAGGVLAIVLLALAGLYPLALVAASIAWGVVAGVATGWALRVLLPVDLAVRAGLPEGEALVRGVAVPLVEGALMLLGPLALLRYRRFNDVLDGVTFGATSAVCFTGALAIVGAV